MFSQVTLPTGTVVDIEGIGNGRIFTIYIRPSVLDIGQTEGLCGSLNGDSNDDFIAKDETITNPSSCDGLLFNEENQPKTDHFANSWRYCQYFFLNFGIKALRLHVV